MVGLGRGCHLLVETEMLHPHLEEREPVSTGGVAGADETNNCTNLELTQLVDWVLDRFH